MILTISRLSALPSSPLEPFSRTERVIAFCRVLLALGTLALVVVDPTLPSYRRDIAYPVLLGYLAIGIVLFALVRAERVRREVMAPVSTAIDIVWICLMTVFTERVASPFFLLNVFVISSVSVRWGLMGAAPVTLLLALLYPAVIFTAGALDLDPGLFRFNRGQLLRPIYLIPIGYLLGYLGEHERQSKRRTALMLSLMQPQPIGYTPGRTVTRIMRRTLRYFHASRGVLVLRDPDNGQFFSWDIRFSDGRATLSLRIADRDPHPWPDVPITAGALANQLAPGSRSALCYDVSTAIVARHPIAPTARLPIDDATSATSLLMAPILVQLDELRGRVYVIRDGGRKFSRDDLEFLVLLVGQVTTMLESRRLQAKAEEVAVLEERARIARDLHDGFIQSLAGIDLRVEACKTWLERDPSRVPAALQDLHQAVERGYKEVRHFLNVLRTTSRPAVDVAVSLDRMAADFSMREGIAVRVVRPPHAPSLSATTSYELTHIVREALQNAIRHGRATEAVIELAVHPTQIVLVVRDNGGGFAEAIVRDAEGFLPPGVHPWSIRERTAALGGTLRVRSRRGSGVELHLTIPAGGATHTPAESRRAS